MANLSPPDLNMDLLAQMSKAVQDMREHDHNRDDIFCLNLTGYLGERAGTLLVYIDGLTAAIAERDRTIARLTAEVAEARRKPAPCSECKITDEECMRRVNADGRPCCGRCHITDTHGGNADV